jgi:hypothetical protein
MSFDLKSLKTLSAKPLGICKAEFWFCLAEPKWLVYRSSTWSAKSKDLVCKALRLCRAVVYFVNHWQTSTWKVLGALHLQLQLLGMQGLKTLQTVCQRQRACRPAFLSEKLGG